ncbi:fibronectin type III domain-containing protein [Flavobacterium sp. MDT1-60]|uniref:fibronectin type III domain-containing protein n=1 Tax=Flavobacterium sp. MDT1-60 TaxID=1979344 RepID=UPI00177B48CE|nr:fibronectin type III domain-containing protein [Flavobacterium sp. MDT1-60]QOG04324.1 fibronectin type III domain-containing protein [Flavobacterium sp. MDT1-60]
MKQVNFSHSGGFPLEQETLEKLQTAYRSELYEALKRHLSIDNNNDYIVAHATSEAKGWAVIRQEDAVNPENQTGILYPIKNGTPTNYLKTTRTETNLIYGTGESQPAYYDYEAEYSPAKLNDGVFVSESGQVQTVYYYDVRNFKIVKDIQAIEEILQAIQSNINAIEANIDVVEGDINAIETNINVIEADINLINQSYLPLNGSKAMQGDLDLGTHQLSKLDTNQTLEANVRARDFRLGYSGGRGLLHQNDYLGRALVDNSTASTTNLTLNYGPDWDNTYIGGKVYLDNINTTSSNGSSLLVLDNQNQVIKNSTLINSLLNRIQALEDKPATAVPLGMVAIWGKPAPFPEGWEEYVPLKGKIPVGLNILTPEEKTDAQDGDGGNGISYYRDNYGNIIYPFETLGSTGGRMAKKLSINEIPAHTHTETRVKEGLGSIINFEAVGDDGHLGYESVASGPAGGGQTFSILNPYRVVQFIEYTGRPKDSTAPTNPTNLQVSNIRDTSVTLSWSASTDEYGVTNYIIYGNGISPIITGNVLSYTVSGLSQDTSYNFYVKARDAAENLSTESNTVNFTTTITDLMKPSTPTGLMCSPDGDSYINISWNPSTDNLAVVRYVVYRRIAGGSSQVYVGTPDNFCTVYGTAGTTYYFKVLAVDAAGNESLFSSEVVGYVESEGGGGSCFDVESLVTMASGQSKKLKNIVVGDKLQGFSFPNEIDESDGDYFLWNGKLDEATKTDVTVVNKITSVQPNYYEIKMADTTIKVTGEHPLLVTQDGENLQWISVKNVSQSMLLIDKTGKTKAIESITFKEEPLEVALLDVENVDNYVISGIVAHNNKPEDPQDPQL